MKSFLIILSAAVLFYSCGDGKSHSAGSIKLSHSVLYESQDFRFTDAKLSPDNHFLAAVTDSPEVSLQLIQTGTDKIIFSFNSRPDEFIFTKRGSLLFRISEFNPEKNNILYYYNIETDSLTKILSASRRIHSLGVFAAYFVFALDDSVRIYDERNLSETGSTKEFDYSFIFGDRIFSVKDGKVAADKKNEPIVWFDYAGKAKAYYLKRSGLFVDLPKGERKALGEILYPELNRKGDLLLGIEEKYDGQKMIKSVLRIFKITENSVVPAGLSVENAYSPHWNADGKSIIYIDNHGSIDAVELIPENL